MSELNFSILREHIRDLLKKNNLTQENLAEIAGMTQANVSKALSETANKEFTIDQVFRIAQHFGLSIDELVGNRAAEEASTSPRFLLTLFSKLLCEGIIRPIEIEQEEWVYEPFSNAGVPDCNHEKRIINYTSFFFPDYFALEDFASNDQEFEDIHYEFMYGGNDTPYKKLNVILKKLIPMINLYRETEIPDEAYQMVLKGYLDQLPKK